MLSVANGRGITAVQLKSDLHGGYSKVRGAGDWARLLEAAEADVDAACAALASDQRRGAAAADPPLPFDGAEASDADTWVSPILRLLLGIFEFRSQAPPLRAIRFRFLYASVIEARVALVSGWGA